MIFQLKFTQYCILLIKFVFSMKGGSTKLVRDIVREYAGNLGSQEAAEEEGGDRRRAETEHLLSLVDKF